MTAPADSFPTAAYISAYERGALDEEHVVELFQHLVDTGKAWTLQGWYGDVAVALIEKGVVKAPSG